VKLITVVLRPALFDPLKQALALFGVRGMTIAQVYRGGDSAGRVEMYRGQRFSTDLEPCLRIELLAENDETPDLVHVISRIVSASGTAQGRVWITEVNLVVRVRTGEYGADAI
jgi:nitrogen regulatory protein P-II 1